MDEPELRHRLGDALVDDFVGAADAVGRSYLDGDEHLVFGFLQRVLAHMRNAGRDHGLLFPKRDERYQPMFDYFDGSGRITVMRPAELGIQPGWTRQVDAYFEIPAEQARPIVLAFLGTYVRLRDEATR